MMTFGIFGTRLTTVLTGLLGSVATMAVLACSGAESGSGNELVGLPSGEYSTIGQDIVSGQTSSLDYVVKVVRSGVGTCTGTLLRNNIVLTAGHCTGTVNGGQWVTHRVSNPAGQSATIAQADLVELAGTDLAIARLSDPLPISGQTAGGWVELSYAAPSSLVNQTANCVGYGDGVCSTTGAGAQKKAALKITAGGTNTLTYSANNSNQTLEAGDSGGPCFLSGSLLGVTRTAADDCLSGNQTPAATNADWIRTTTGDLSPHFWTSFSAASDLNLFDFVLPSTFTGGTASWFVSADTLSENSNVQSTSPSPADSGPMALAKGVVVADAWAATRIYSPDDDIGGLLFRYQDTNNHYRIVADPTSVRVEKVAGGAVTVLGTSTPGVNWPSTVDLGVRGTGTTLEVYINGTFRFSVVDSTFRTGRVGFTKTALSNTSFHYLDVIHNG